MPATVDTLMIVGDGIQIDIAAGENYALTRNGWSPKVATRRESVIGNQSPFNDVVEEMVINIYGADVDEVLEKVTELNDLLDNSERWARGDITSPVTLEYLPKGSEAVGVYKAEIKGAAGTNNLLELKPEYNIDLRLYTIQDVRLRFVRSGDWYIDSQMLNNLVSNSSFENYVTTGGLPPYQWSGWFIYALGGLPPYPQPDTTPANVLFGNASLNFPTYHKDGYRVVYANIEDLTPGASYTVTYWTKGTLSDGGVGEMIDFDLEAFNYLLTSASSIETSGAWTRYKATRVAPASGALQIRLVANYLDGSIPAIWVDGVTFTRGTDAPPAWFEDIPYEFNAYGFSVGGSPYILSADFGSSTIPSSEAVIQLGISPFSSEVSVGQFFDDGYLLYNTGDLEGKLVHATDMITSGSGFSTVVNTEAWQGDVLRFTPATLAEVSLQINYTEITNASSVAVFILAKTSIPVPFTVRAVSYPSALTGIQIQEKSDVFTVVNDPPNIPLFFFLGTMPLAQRRSRTMLLRIKPTSLSATLDINYAVVWPMDDHAGVMQFPQLDSQSNLNLFSLGVRPYALEQVLPKATMTAFDGTRYSIPALGNVRPTTQSPKINVLPLFKKFTDWRYKSGSSYPSFALSVNRKLTYRIPR
jgi:hypothetical protein